MTYEKDPFEYQGIPDYALQPAKEADEYNFHYVPRGGTSRFDPAAYERVLHDSVRQAFESGEESEMLYVQGDESALYQYDQTPAEDIPQPAASAEKDAEPELEAVFDVKEEAVAVEIIAETPAEVLAEVSVETPAEVLAETVVEVSTETPVEVLAETIVEVSTETPAEVLAETVVEVSTETQAEVLAEVSEDISEIEEIFKEEVSAEFPETNEDTIPIFAPQPSRPALQATRPAPQPVFVPKTVSPKFIPVSGSTLSSRLKLVDLKRKEPLRVAIDEDILVPDVKPDLAYILAMDGKIKLAEREIHTGQAETDRVRILGDLILQTLYVPEHITAGEPIIAIESKIPFRNETELKAGPYSDLVIAPRLESIDYTVVNERKIRVRAVAVFGIKEYGSVEVEVFEGIKDEEVQMLKERINLTDVAARKTESIEIKDDFTLKENMPEILKILKYDISVVENHKQITKEKAVINASVYCNALYLGAEEDPGSEASEDVEAVSVTEMAAPVLYQGKTEFTQFIRLDGDYNPSDQSPAGSKINFNIASVNLAAKEDANGKRSLFGLDMNVDTELELYKNVEKEIVTDVYHHLKDVEYETDEIGVMALGGSGVAEISAREIVNIPERYGSVDKVAYISGNISEKRSFIDQTRSIVEGVVTVNLICTSAGANKTAFNVVQEIPFRSAMEIPGITPEMTASNDIVLKELWFDKINNKQIEVNAGILVNTAVSSQRKHQLVKNVSFLDSPQDRTALPGIILYIARSGDNIWNIAKKYRTTIDELKKINDLEFGKEIRPGTKLLIVAKNY
ncbi:MAG TPA: SPOCS domain-containing protein [Anaerovoracaceae bacterium]|nr:SPOCS domain-containing protein [Anaerovoracaceae bacterium]